ncbi:MAG: hypothetical protein WB616_08940 [Candidatus Sulfotelmatobacter sp.]|jgi:hypothetical protein
MRGFLAEPFEMVTKSSVKVRPKIVPLDSRNPQQQSITGQAAAPAPIAWGPEETDFRRQPPRTGYPAEAALREALAGNLRQAKQQVQGALVLSPGIDVEAVSAI